jgi:hypothetical protein
MFLDKYNQQAQHRNNKSPQATGPDRQSTAKRITILIFHSPFFQNCLLPRGFPIINLQALLVSPSIFYLPIVYLTTLSAADCVTPNERMNIE